MKTMVIVADAVNDKINRIIKTLHRTKGIHEVYYFIEILESIKIWDIKINTDYEVYVTFKDKEVMRFSIERDLIK